MDIDAKLRRLTALKGLRQPHESVWRQCFDYTHPVRGSGFNGSSMSAADAQARKNRIMDGTATDSARILASALMSGLTPPNSRWFSLDVGTETDEERRWLDETAQTIFENIHAGNFDASAFECCIDVVDAGWFVLYTEVAKEGGFRFEQWPIPQCFISSSKSGGLVDTIYREFEYTVEQCVAEYGIDKVSDQVREKFNGQKFSEPVRLVHIIEPRAVHKEGSGISKKMPFASIHIEITDRHPVRESGYPYFPCAAPRWMLIPGSMYATGPVADALPDIMTLNQIKALELSSLDMALVGMWKATDDGVFNGKTIRLGPRKVVMMNDPQNNMLPLETGVDFKVGFTAEERLQNAIRKAMLADQLKPQDSPAMTATEVHARVQLIRQLLGPIYGRLQAEYLQVLIEICFAIVMQESEPAWRMGLPGIVTPPPLSLRNRNFHVRYISPLARAQKMEEVSSIATLVQGTLAIAAVDPSVLDTINMDEAQRVTSEGLNVPPKVMASDKEIAAKRDARQKAQQAQAQQAAQMQTQQEVGSAVAQKVATA